jgi:WD40 repeat protein
MNAVEVLVLAEGLLVSGSGCKKGCIRVWDVVTGRCDGVLEGHKFSVMSLSSSCRLL